MKVVVQCLEAKPDSYTGKRGPVENLRCAMLDDEQTPGARMINSFDFDLSGEEKTKWGGTGMTGKRFLLGITDFTFAFGRLRARGRVLEEVKK